MSEPREFTKIKYAKNVDLEWNTTRKTASQAEEHQSHQLTCPEKPRPAFNSALQGLLGLFLTIIGAPADWEKNTTITGLSVNREEDGRRGAIITASRKCPHGAAPIAINTPHLRESMDPAKEKGPNFWLPNMDQLIDQLFAEAEAYLSGDRAQVEMFDKTQKKDGGEGGGAKTKGKGGEPEKVEDVMKRVPSAERAD